MTTCVGVFALGLIGLTCCPSDGRLTTFFGVITLGSAVAVPLVVFIA